MAKVGRKSAYETKIKPNFPEILEMCKTMTDKQISESLGVNYSTFLKYKAEKTEFSELLIKGRQNLVAELRGILIKKAKGYTYEEKKIVSDSNGFTKQEIVQKYALPDTGAIHLLLKNYDSENWSNDPLKAKLQKEEFKLKKEQIEKGDW